MRSSLRAPIISLLSLAALPACTVNYYVPAATDAPTASNGPQRVPPRTRWQPEPGPHTSYPPRQYSPVASAPQPSPAPAPYPAPTPGPGSGPGRSTPSPAPGPPRHGPVRQAPVPNPTPAPQPAPPKTGGVKPSKPLTESAPAPTPTTVPAPTPTTFPTQAPSPTPVPEPTSPTTPPVLQTEQTTDTNQPLQVSPVIVFGKTPCFGKCPHFTAQIYASGRMHYEGFKYAPVEGQQDVQLSPAVVNEILQAAEARQFRSFNAEYASGASDMPSTGLTITYPDGSKKSVRVEGDAPAELQQLLALINARIETALSVVNDR